MLKPPTSVGMVFFWEADFLTKLSSNSVFHFYVGCDWLGWLHPGPHMFLFIPFSRGEDLHIIFLVLIVYCILYIIFWIMNHGLNYINKIMKSPVDKIAKNWSFKPKKSVFVSTSPRI